MKKSYKIIILHCLFIYCCFFVSCSNTYDDLLDAFNEKYFSQEPTPVEEKTVADDDFDPDKMLDRTYTFVDGFQTSLSAPAGAASYDWSIKDKKSKEGEAKSVCNKQVFDFMPGKFFKAGEESTLVLTVTDTSGTVYIDTAVIILITRN